MACTSPFDVWPAGPDAQDRRPVFSPARSYQGAKSFQVPCGKCYGCRIEHASEWGVRCAHQAQLSGLSCFVTLTYSDEFLPVGGTLIPDDLRNFVRRVRVHFADVKYFGCGEYGPTTLRPHYHIILFGVWFDDAVVGARDGDDRPRFSSALLSKLWPYGLSEFSHVSFANAKYIAKYSTKLFETHGDYVRVDPATGETWQVYPQFLRMSRRPGIGDAWYKQFSGDAFPSDFVIVDGQRLPVPRYYWEKLREENPMLYHELRGDRAAAARERALERTDARMMTKHRIGHIRAAGCVRGEG